MNIKQLQYFLMVAEAGSITAAAKRLHISQPPLSNQMHLLEEELGTQLFERGSRKITLTYAGEILYNRAQTIVDLSSAAIREITDLGSGLQGTIHLGTISSCGVVLLDQYLKQFHDQYPGVSFELYEGNTFQLLEKLKSGSIEIAIVRTPFHEEGFSCIYLEEEPMVAVGSTEYLGHLLTDTITLEQLTDVPLIYYRRFENLLMNSFKTIGKVPKVYCKNDDARTSLMWAQAGLGVAITPRSITPAIPGNHLIYKIIDVPALYTKIAAIYRKDLYLSNIGQRFIKMFDTNTDY
ncbi:LysR family transcriptional regulator [Anaerosporobacter faecicola]|uniref:LysR family transcriptional regulator n=1 Tax=Anaerosporobacter faecicola TaxID=2718714 RepID=UPI00143AA0EF|nr:LysR family transcriptional regulator [Anaerosporobacter faecicola]